MCINVFTFYARNKIWNCIGEKKRTRKNLEIACKNEYVENNETKTNSYVEIVIEETEKQLQK